MMTQDVAIISVDLNEYQDATVLFRGPHNLRLTGAEFSFVLE